MSCLQIQTGKRQESLWKDLRKKAIRARLWREWNYDRKRKDCSDYSCSQYPGCSDLCDCRISEKEREKIQHCHESNGNVAVFGSRCRFSGSR